MGKLLRRLWLDQQGQDLVEYALTYWACCHGCYRFL
jgi:hypothetical protein